MADDSAGFDYNVTEQFDVTKENITINVTGGNNSMMNRSDSNAVHELTLAFQVWDTIKNQPITLLDNATELFTFIKHKDTEWY